MTRISTRNRRAKRQEIAKSRELAKLRTQASSLRADLRHVREALKREQRRTTPGFDTAFLSELEKEFCQHTAARLSAVVYDARLKWAKQCFEDHPQLVRDLRFVAPDQLIEMAEHKHSRSSSPVPRQWKIDRAFDRRMRNVILYAPPVELSFVLDVD